MSQILALNCGSSSVKAKVYSIGEGEGQGIQPELFASIAISNINAQAEKIGVKLKWADGRGKDINEEQDSGDAVKHLDMVPVILDKLSENGTFKPDNVKYVVHRIVHGGTHKRGIIVTKDHTEGLTEMDKLSEFAPLHNHHAVLAVKSCLKALPDHQSLLVFDTLFHQTIPESTFTYAIPPPELDVQMPLRKYGFHGLSYASIVRSIARHKGKSEEDVSIVVAHLGSGASACCILKGKSIDTSMGLTPLEGLIGGTRSGTIDPTAIFHHTKDAALDAGLPDFKVSKAEAVLNKKSGLQALAGTTNFGQITANMAKDPKLRLAYDVYLDRLMGYVSQYLCKLLSNVGAEGIDGIIFSGGIGEKAEQLRKDVVDKFGWLGMELDKEANKMSEGEVRRITSEKSKIHGWVVETDEEGWCVHLAGQEFGF